MNGQAEPVVRPLRDGRLTLYITGSINACLVPWWLTWLREMRPGLCVSVCLTRAAERFVTLRSLDELVAGRAFVDMWGASSTAADHMKIDRDSDFFGIFPATLNTTMSLANGLADTPMRLALQMTRKPIALAIASPASNEVTQELQRRLITRSNVAFSRTVPAYSVSRQDWSGTTGFHLPHLLEALSLLDQPREASE